MNMEIVGLIQLEHPHTENDTLYFSMGEISIGVDVESAQFGIAHYHHVTATSDETYVLGIVTLKDAKIAESQLRRYFAEIEIKYIKPTTANIPVLKLEMEGLGSMYVAAAEDAARNLVEAFLGEMEEWKDWKQGAKITITVEEMDAQQFSELEPFEGW